MQLCLPYISFKHLHSRVFVKVDIFYDKLDSTTEFFHIPQDGQGVQGVNKGEGVITQDVIDVDIGPANQNKNKIF